MLCMEAELMKYSFQKFLKNVTMFHGKKMSIFLFSFIHFLYLINFLIMIPRL